MFLHQKSQCFSSLKLMNCLEARLMLLLKDSKGVNWHEELPDDPANPGRGLEGAHPVDSINLVLVG